MVPSTVSLTKKLTQQYVGPFQVIERVDRLAYRLAVHEDWRVHPIFNIWQLDSCSSPHEDPSRRLRPRHIPPMSANEEGTKNYEVERLLNKRTICKGRGLATEGLVPGKTTDLNLTRDATSGNCVVVFCYKENYGSCCRVR